MIMFLIWLISLPFTMMYHAFVVAKLWAWFIVPTFGLDPLTLPVAYGLSLIASFLTYQHDFSSDNADFGGHFSEGLIVAIVMPTVALFFGFIVSSFM